MNSRNKLAEMPIRPLLYTMAVPLMLSLLGQLLQLFSASSEMLTLGIPALRIISISFVMSAITILCGYFSSGLGNGIINMVGAAIRQLILLVPCLWIFIKISGISHGWYAFWIAELIACIYSYCMSHKLLKTIFV